jgi:hypothetical protein
MFGRILRGLLAGVVAGLVVLGIGGRIVMRVLALVTHRPPHFGLGASLGILLIGAVLGTLACVPLIALTWRRPTGASRPAAWRGMLYGSLVFLLLIPLQPAAIREEVSALRGHMPLILALFWAIFASYGLVLQHLLSRSVRPPAREAAV